MSGPYCGGIHGYEPNGYCPHGKSRRIDCSNCSIIFEVCSYCLSHRSKTNCNQPWQECCEIHCPNKILHRMSLQPIATSEKETTKPKHMIVIYSTFLVSLSIISYMYLV